MRRTDLWTAASFLALGVFLVVQSLQLPPGMGRLPGPGFFPAIVGLVITALALALGADALRARTGKTVEGNPRLLLATVALTGVYLLLWGTIPFAIRTVLYLCAFLLLCGTRWKPALAVSVGLTAFVLAAFQYGLRISLE